MGFSIAWSRPECSHSTSNDVQSFMQKGSMVQLGVCTWELPLGPGPASETISILYKAAELLARIYNFFTFIKGKPRKCLYKYSVTLMEQKMHSKWRCSLLWTRHTQLEESSFLTIECLCRVRTDGLYYLEKKSHDPPILAYCSAKIIRSKDVRLSDFGNILMQNNFSNFFLKIVISFIMRY